MEGTNISGKRQTQAVLNPIFNLMSSAYRNETNSEVVVHNGVEKRAFKTDWLYMKVPSSHRKNHWPTFDSMILALANCGKFLLLCGNKLVVDVDIHTGSKPEDGDQEVTRMMVHLFTMWNRCGKKCAIDPKSGKVHLKTDMLMTDNEVRKHFTSLKACKSFIASKSSLFSITPEGLVQLKSQLQMLPTEEVVLREINHFRKAGVGDDKMLMANLSEKARHRVRSVNELRGFMEMHESQLVRVSQPPIKTGSSLNNTSPSSVSAGPSTSIKTTISDDHIANYLMHVFVTTPRTVGRCSVDPASGKVHFRIDWLSTRPRVMEVFKSKSMLCSFMKSRRKLFSITKDGLVQSHSQLSRLPTDEAVLAEIDRLRSAGSVDANTMLEKLSPKSRQRVKTSNELRDITLMNMNRSVACVQPSQHAHAKFDLPNVDVHEEYHCQEEIEDFSPLWNNANPDSRERQVVDVDALANPKETTRFDELSNSFHALIGEMKKIFN